MTEKGELSAFRATLSPEPFFGYYWFRSPAGNPCRSPIQEDPGSMNSTAESATQPTFDGTKKPSALNPTPPRPNTACCRNYGRHELHVSLKLQYGQTL